MNSKVDSSRIEAGMAVEIPKAYESQAVESYWYNQWMEAGAFKGPQVPEGEKGYSIVIPPPNVTGVLTMGHVLNNTIQDVLIRRKRQEGKPSMWIPGTDHAGIATQTKVEQALKKEGKDRRDLGREKFVQKACEWRDEHGGLIFKQLEKLGASCDWDRSVHTLDEDYSEGVLTCFVELFKRGYIYRGKRMVNWCPKSLTALSDEEVIAKPCEGKLYTVNYELVDEPGVYVQIATTRPETIMGDAALAVHPEDERYKHLIGNTCYRPLAKRAIPIIADEAVEIDFGTGALKITPAHDKLDFEIGQRHDLAVIDLMHPNGTLNALAGSEFEGMDRFDARKKAVAMLEEMGALVKTEVHENNVGYSERADVPIEPRLSNQWFLKYPKVDEAKQVVRDGTIKFWPQPWEKTYLHWLENIQDWCISRQLWWGHRIPVWYKKGEDKQNPENWHVSLEGPADKEDWEQEEDVLDTWFSSWIWPIATMGWPNKEAMAQKQLEAYYPTGDLVTGPDIIFFWVSRMIMASLEFMPGEKLEDKVPFKNVYFTGIIRDAKGRKMSKSLGNSPNPLDLIAKYGADGLRLGVLSMAPQGQDILFFEDRVDQGKHFCNKLWNACRFRQMSGDMADNSLEGILARLGAESMDIDDHGILSRLLETISAVEDEFGVYSFNGVTQVIYGFFWNDFCDWYLETAKARMGNAKEKGHVLAIQDLVIRVLLQMLYPITPFIAEELWHKLGYGAEGEFLQNVELPAGESLLGALADKGIALDGNAASQVLQLRDWVTQVRSLKAEYKMATKRDVSLFFKDNASNSALLEQNSSKLQKMAGFESLKQVTDTMEAPSIVTELGTVYLDLASSIDVESEKKRIEAELAKLAPIIKAGAAKLSENSSFVSKAPEKVVAGAIKMHEANIAKRDELSAILKSLG